MIGKGQLQFKSSNCEFDEEVRIMRALRSNMLIVFMFRRKFGLHLNREHGTGSVFRLGQRHYSKVSWMSNEEELGFVMKLIEYFEVDHQILHELDVSELFKDPAMIKNFRDWILNHLDIFKGFACINWVGHKIKLKPDV